MSPNPSRRTLGGARLATAVFTAAAALNEYAPLWKALSPETSRKVRLGNYERLFDDARRKVRTWEKAQGL